MNENIIAITLMAIITVVTSFGALFFKKGSERLDWNPLHQLKNKNLLIGIFLYTAPAPVYIYCLKIADLSIIYPISSLTYVWVSLFSIRFLNERMNKYKWLGIFFIILGVSAITYASSLIN